MNPKKCNFCKKMSMFKGKMCYICRDKWPNYEEDLKYEKKLKLEGSKCDVILNDLKNNIDQKLVDIKLIKKTVNKMKKLKV